MIVYRTSRSRERPGCRCTVYAAIGVQGIQLQEPLHWDEKSPSAIALIVGIDLAAQAVPVHGKFSWYFTAYALYYGAFGLAKARAAGSRAAELTAAETHVPTHLAIS